MKVVGFTALHYGRDYLAWSIRSVIDHIDEYHVAYTAIGSHGHRTQIPCPESRDELYAIASAAAGSKLRWHDGEWAYEGAQRDSIHEYAPDADVIVVLDADEIWADGLVEFVLSSALNNVAPRITRVGIIHYWRSFYRAVLHDPADPVRMICPRARDGETTCDVRYRGQVINHMGYAQRPEIVEYKILTHGHKNEIRRDCDWFNDVYMNTRRDKDLHLVGSEYWNTERVDPLDFMPKFMMDHAYYHMSIIE